MKFDEHVREVLVSIARKNLPPIQDRLNLIEREREILPGIQAIAATGHTPGHMALVTSSGGAQLLYISDTVLHPIQLEQPERCAAVDYDPDQVVASRLRILNRAAAEKALVLAFHFSFPGLGHVVWKGDTWEWQPIATMVQLTGDLGSKSDFSKSIFLSIPYLLNLGLRCVVLTYPESGPCMPFLFIGSSPCTPSSFLRTVHHGSALAFGQCLCQRY